MSLVFLLNENIWCDANKSSLQMFSLSKNDLMIKSLLKRWDGPSYMYMLLIFNYHEQILALLCFLIRFLRCSKSIQLFFTAQGVLCGDVCVCARACVCLWVSLTDDVDLSCLHTSFTGCRRDEFQSFQQAVQMKRQSKSLRVRLPLFVFVCDFCRVWWADRCQISDQPDFAHGQCSLQGLPFLHSHTSHDIHRLRVPAGVFGAIWIWGDGI